MKKLALILLALLPLLGTAQEVKTKYIDAKGKVTTKLESAISIETEKFDDKGDLLSYELQKNGELIEAMYFEDGLPTGNWISDGKIIAQVMEIPINCKECRETLNTAYTPESMKLLTIQLSKIIRYPEYAVRNNIQGRITILCKVDENKNIVSLCITKKGHPVLNLEAIRVISLLNLDELFPELNTNCLIIPVEFKLN